MLMGCVIELSLAATVIFSGIVSRHPVLEGIERQGANLVPLSYKARGCSSQLDEVMDPQGYRDSRKSTYAET